MDLRAIAATTARIGMGLVGASAEGGTLEAVTLKLHGVGAAFDPATDTVGGGVTSVACDALAFRRKNVQAGAGLQVSQRDSSGTTETLLIEAAALPPGTLITEEDAVTRASGEWAIVAVEFPPGQAVWLLDVRH